MVKHQLPPIVKRALQGPDVRFGRARSDLFCELTAPPTVPTGKVNCFGPVGPKYEVGKALRLLEDGDWMIEVTMVETGEKVEYRWSRLMDDPEAV